MGTALRAIIRMAVYRGGRRLGLGRVLLLGAVALLAYLALMGDARASHPTRTTSCTVTYTAGDSVYSLLEWPEDAGPLNTGIGEGADLQIQLSDGEGGWETTSSTDVSENVTAFNAEWTVNAPTSPGTYRVRWAFYEDHEESIGQTDYVCEEFIVEEPPPPEPTVVALHSDDRDRLDLIWIGVAFNCALTLGVWWGPKVWGELRQWFNFPGRAA